MRQVRLTGHEAVEYGEQQGIMMVTEDPDAASVEVSLPEGWELFRIESKAGHPFGLWKGRTRAEALLGVHRDAGYGPKVVDLSRDRQSLVFCDDGQPDAEYREICGDVEDWVITQVS